MIVRSAAAASSGQDVDFEDDPVFNEFLYADGNGSNVGTLGRGNPGWSLSQFLIIIIIIIIIIINTFCYVQVGLEGLAVVVGRWEVGGDR